MNLAMPDVQNDLSRFTLTAVGLGLLLTIVLAMTGIYNGILQDATALPDCLGCDLWVVQRNTRGPFAELSRISPDMEERARAVPGVLSARSYVSHTIQRELPTGEPIRFTSVGLSWPDDRGGNLPIVDGRALAQPHFECIADRSLGLSLGARLPLGRDIYQVVGVTEGLLASGGDPAVFFSRSDAQSIQYDQSNEAIRLDRESRSRRLNESSLRNIETLRRRSLEPNVASPAIGPPPIAAVLIDVMPGVDPEDVRRQLEEWRDITVYTQEQQDELILGGVVEKTKKQIGLFRGLLVIISAILMSLIIYTMTVDKIHSIALLKLLGAKPQVILGMILQEALLLGGIAYAIAILIGNATFHLFPRRVVVGNEHRLTLLGIVLVISVAASLIGMKKALAADPNEVLAS